MNTTHRTMKMLNINIIIIVSEYVLFWSRPNNFALQEVIAYDSTKLSLYYCK